MENKTSKYFKYAIGEIVLVVIGILLAVQINSWRNNAQIKKSNKVSLTKIVEELKLNKDRLDLLAFQASGGVNSLKDAVLNCDSLLKISSKGYKESDLEYLIIADIYAGSSQLNLYDATYEELLNTGRLYTLGSDSIILAIKNYYKRYEREIEYNKKWTDYTISGYKMIEPTIVKLRMDNDLNPEAFKLENYTWYFNPKSEKYVNMQLGLRRMRGGQRHDLGKCISLIEESDKLITILEKELNDIYN